MTFEVASTVIRWRWQMNKTKGDGMGVDAVADEGIAGSLSVPSGRGRRLSWD